MKRILFAIIIPLYMLCMSSCGMSRITVNDPNAEIFVNNVYKGKGTAEVTRMGFPKKLHIEAKCNNSTVGSIIVKRKFDGVSLLMSICTRGYGFIFSFRYPKNILIPIIDAPTESAKPKENIWMKKPVWK